jgi:hypothetical protein
VYSRAEDRSGGAQAKCEGKERRLIFGQWV